MDFTRREFLKTSGLAAAGLMASGLFSRVSAFQQNKPNIIYILADDLGYGDLSWYGQKRFKTPNIDSIAKHGMTFTQHYSGSTVCAPSRCTLMTGYHTGNCTVRDNFNKDGERVSMTCDDITVARLLKDAGYTTGAVGKWGLAEPGTDGTPNRKGFDFWYGYLNQKRAHSYYPEYVWKNEEKEYLPGNENGGRGTYVHDRMTEEALGFIERSRDEPFYLYLPYTIPHSDLDVPDDSLDKYKGKYPETPYSDDEFSTDYPRAAYAAMISRMDRDIGKIVDLLKAQGTYENTIIMFSSDNGPSPKNGGDVKFFDGNGPFKGAKRDLYEGGIRVPFVVQWPAKIKAGSVSDHVSAFWDVLPTLTDIAGAEKPAEIDGLSFAPVLLGQEQKEQHDNLYWEFTLKDKSYQAARFADWKAIRSEKGIELYDLSSDPGELFDVAQHYPGLVEKAMELFEAERTPSDEYHFYLE